MTTSDLLHTTRVLPNALSVAESYGKVVDGRRSACALGLFLICPRPGTIGSQPQSAVWPIPRALDPAQGVNRFVTPDSPGWSQAVSDIGLQWNPAQETPEPTHPLATQLAPQVALVLGRHQSHWGKPSSVGSTDT